MKADIIIIGSGPAGLFAAIEAGGKERRVLVLERNSCAGKKLLISGAGQCNLTHDGDIKDFLNFYGDNGRFVKHALFKFSNENLIEFFKKNGLKLICNEGGKVFPETLKSSSVLEVLLKECRKKDVNIKYNQRVKEALHSKESGLFYIKTEDSEYESKYLVIATGGKSYGNTGSTGDGYIFAQKLGHTIEKPAPALAPIYIKGYDFKELSGLSFENRPISLWRNNKKIRSSSGDVLLTHKNISGPGILNFSRYVLPGDIVKINFVGAKSEEEFRSSFIKKVTLNGKLLVKTILKEFQLPKRFTDKLLELLNIPEDHRCAELNKKTRSKLIEMLISFPMEVEGLGEFHLAMATRGGISLKEVSPKTMESRIVRGLYFAGEVLDIDGDTGGYNIQAAISMGRLAADSISQKEEEGK